MTVENTALAIILASIVKRTEQMEKTTRAVLDGKIGQGPNQNQNQILLNIQEKVEALERRLGDVPPKTGDKITTAPRTWSNVVKENHLLARIEVRLEEIEGTDKESLEERLKRIRKVIPDAQAIIPHPRAPSKVSVVVRDSKRRDQIIQVGLQGAEGMKLIRRPYLVLVSGISLDAKIQNRKCEENDTWLTEARKRNGAGLERVEWLYSTKELRKRRGDP